MTLFGRIKNDPAFQNPQDFIYLLLRRLSIAEAEIISHPRDGDIFQDDLIQDKMIISEIDTKCKERQYPESHSDVIIELFRAITVLIGLIKDERFIQSKDISAVNNIKEALVLANTITQEQGLKLKLKDYAALLTEQMLDSLIKPECITSPLEALQPLLTSCFPLIDQMELIFAVSNMRQLIYTLQLVLESTPVIVNGVKHQSSAPELKTAQSKHVLPIEGQKGYINNNLFEKLASNTVSYSPISSCISGDDSLIATSVN